MDEARSIDPARAATPSDHEYFPMGAYGPGTLRITNGSASPEPGQIRQSLDRGFVSSDDYETAPSSPNNGEDIISMQPAPLHRQTLDNIVNTLGAMQEAWNVSADALPKANETQAEMTESRKSRRFSEPAMSGIPVPEIQDEASPRLYRPTRRDRSTSRDQSRETSRPHTLRSRASSHSQLPVPVDSSAANQPPVDSKTENTQTPRDSADAQTSMPRFAQRWSHRMSFLPPDSDANTQLPSAPCDNNTALINLSKRLSTVTDKSGKEKDLVEVTVKETPDVALAKLTGQLEHPAFRRSAEHGVVNVRPSVDSLAEPTDPSPLLPVQTQGDSGYGSDISNQSTEPKEAKESGMVYRQFSSTAPPKPLAHKAYTGLSNEHDEISLYSFNAVLKDPTLLQGLATPSPPPSRGNRKHLSLLGLGRKKSSPQPGLILNNDALQSPSGDLRASKSKKKLQKPMPAAVREEMKATKKRVEADRHSKELGTVPDVPQDVATSFFRRSLSEPPAHAMTEQSASIGVSESFPMLLAELSSDSEASACAGPQSDHSAFRSSRDSHESKPTRAVKENVGPVREHISDGESRSVSSKRSGSTTPRASNFEQKCPLDGDVPSHTATRRSSIESLPTAPSDVSTNISSNPSVRTVVQQDVSLGKAGHEEINMAQGEHSASISKCGAIAGMEASAAAKLARLRSRDIASQSNEDLFEQPKTATPRSRRSTKSEHHKAQALQGGATSQLPETQNNPADQASASLSRSVSVAESIPPLPQLPANLNARASMPVGMAAKGDREITTANESSRVNSIDDPTGYSTESVADAVKKALQYQTGYSTESVVDAIKKARKSRKAHDSSQAEVNAGATHAHPLKAHRSKRTNPKNDRVQSADDISEGDAKPQEDDTPVDGRSATGPNVESEEAGWEEQAKAWRQRRRSAGEALGTLVNTNDKDSERPQLQRYSTSSVHSITRKPVPSSNRNSETTPTSAHKRSDSAELHAAVYRDLISLEKKKQQQQAGVDGVGWRDTTGTFATVYPGEGKNAAEGGSDRTNSVYATKPYQVPNDHHLKGQKAQVAGWSHRMGTIIHTSPTESEQMKRFRSETLAKLTGGATSGPPTPTPVEAPKRPVAASAEC